MNIHMATLSRAIQIQIAQPRGPEMNSPARKGLGESDDNLTNYPGSDSRSTYEEEI
jgi:hypothetical protein